MRVFLTISVLFLLFSVFLPNIVFADQIDDEFGARFYNKAPAGLGDYTAPEDEFPDIAMDDIANSLQNIMPAAGDEEELGTSLEGLAEESEEKIMEE